MTALSIVFYLAFLAFIVVLGVKGLKGFKQEFGGRGGRSYADICSDLYRESERHSEIIVTYARRREERIAKLERR